MLTAAPSVVTTMTAPINVTTVKPLTEATTPYVPKVLDVRVNNKTVNLTEGSTIYEQKVTLSAYVLGGEFYICIQSIYLWL